MESKDFISNISFKQQKKNGESDFFNGQSTVFRLSIKEVYFF